jgi:hypothetical protein
MHMTLGDHLMVHPQRMPTVALAEMCGRQIRSRSSNNNRSSNNRRRQDSKNLRKKSRNNKFVVQAKGVGNEESRPVS